MTKFEASHQLCQVTLLGNLVAKPEIRYLANPLMAVTDVVVATTHRWKDKQNNAKEWTSYHHVKVVGKLVEETLLHANKGDIVLINGYIANNKAKPIEIIHATGLEHFAKGFTQSINQITCSASISSDIQLVNSETNKALASFDIHVFHHAHSEHKGESIKHEVTRPVQLWGQQAQYLAKHAQKGSKIIIEGRLGYANNQQKSQHIDALNIHLLQNS